jgi:VanZ family protein
MAVIFLLSAQSTLPTVQDNLLDAIFKKSGHALAYAMLCLLLARAVRAGQPLRWRHMVLAIAISALYGASDEVHQGFVPGRTPRVFDWTVDVTGAAVGAWIYTKTVHRTVHRAAPSPSSDQAAPRS